MNAHEDRFLPGRRARFAVLFGALSVVLLSAACGKKGPLYLPDEVNTAKPAGQPATQPPPAQPKK